MDRNHTMSKLRRIFHQIAHCILLLFFSAFSTTTFAGDIFRAQGEMTGEVSANSAIVQSRLTSVDRNVEGDVPGAVGVARFEYADSRSFDQSELTPWNSSRAESDFIIKAVLRDLKPATRYYYRVHYGANREDTQTGATCSFRTLQGATGTDTVSFVVVTGMMYGSFHGTDRKEKGPRPDREAGYPALKTMLDMALESEVELRVCQQSLALHGMTMGGLLRLSSLDSLLRGQGSNILHFKYV